MLDHREQDGQDSPSADEEAPPRGDKPIHCRECTILIGKGYLETVPVPAPDGRGYFCWRCSETLARLAEKRAAQVPPQDEW